MTPVPEYLQALNSAQREAVAATEGPVLVLAGAGTGKTRTLCTRLVHLVETRKIENIKEILVVTFTNKAAGEVKERLTGALTNRLAVTGMSSAWIGTFHSLCLRQLRHHGVKVGLDPAVFKIADRQDQERTVKQVIASLPGGMGDVLKGNRASTFVSRISKWKGDDVSPEQAIRSAKDASSEYDLAVATVYRDYDLALRAGQAVDFDDLLRYAVVLLEGHEDVRKYYNELWKYVMVDEAQDTNALQWKWLKLCTGRHRNLCLVGDDDQSIYGWRGARVDQLLSFPKQWPGTTIIRLQENYRSVQRILDAASDLIANNRGRLGKRLVAARRSTQGAATALRGRCEAVRCCGVDSRRGEAEWVATHLTELREAGDAPVSASVAVLVRTQAQTRTLEEAFRVHSLPYRIVGGTAFYERQEVRDVLAFMRLLVDPADSLAMERIVNRPRRGIGPQTVSTLTAFMTPAGGRKTLTVAVDQLAGHSGARVSKKAVAALHTLVHELAAARATATASTAGVAGEMASCMWELLEALQYWRTYVGEHEEESPEWLKRKENIDELLTAVEEHTAKANNAIGDGPPLSLIACMRTFLDEVTLFTDHVAKPAGDSGGDGEQVVEVMTMHAAKGLEFDVVFLPGWSRDQFPSVRSFLTEQSLEEERRLAYVAMTRARRILRLSYIGGPSRGFDARRSAYATDDADDFQRGPSPFLAEAGLDLESSYVGDPAQPTGGVEDDGVDIVGETSTAASGERESSGMHGSFRKASSILQDRSFRSPAAQAPKFVPASALVARPSLSQTSHNRPADTQRTKRPATLPLVRPLLKQKKPLRPSADAGQQRITNFFASRG